MNDHRYIDECIYKSAVSSLIHSPVRVKSDFSCSHVINGYDLNDNSIVCDWSLQSLSFFMEFTVV